MPVTIKKQSIVKITVCLRINASCKTACYFRVVVRLPLLLERLEPDELDRDVDELEPEEDLDEPEEELELERDPEER
jgi:hypothetical protein